MKFAYKKLGPGVYRPVIPIGVEYQGQIVQYEVFVDSGADLCIFNAEIADALGINLARGERKDIGGITGDVEPYYIHPVRIQVGGHPLSVEARFLRNIGRFGYGVVGQKGFFENFIVKFDYIEKEVELRSRE